MRKKNKQIAAADKKTSGNRELILTAVHTNRRPIKFWEQTEDRTDLCCRPEQKKTKVAAAAAAAKSLRHPSHYRAETFVLSLFGEATVLFVQFKKVAKAKCFQCDG